MLAALASTMAAAAERPAIRYVDAHSHIVTSIPADEEIVRMKQAGLSAVVIMDPRPAALQSLVRRYPHFVIPFISAARSADMAGLRLDPHTAGTYGRLQATGAVCGFGEIPTRLDPNPEPSDAAALTNDFRSQIYALAERRRVAVNIHVSLETAATIAAIERILADHPHMPLIIAHAGWMAGPELMGRLLAAHANLHTDLSVRLDRPGAPGADPHSNSIVDPQGVLLPAWRALIERFPDRFLFGLDVTMAKRPDHIAELVDDARHTLGALPLPVEEAVAHGNIERLLHGCGQ